MIQSITKDLTTVTRGIILHGCNAQGVMGSGVAKALRSKWPGIFLGYRNMCDQHAQDKKSLLGMIDLYVDSPLPINNQSLIIMNAITQLNYGKDGKVYADIKAIKNVLDHAVLIARIYSLPIYMPKIGCGLGGLTFDIDLKPVLSSITHDVEIYVCDV